MIVNKKLFSDNDKVVTCLNNFFSNIVQNTEITKYEALNMNSLPNVNAMSSKYDFH